MTFAKPTESKTKAVEGYVRQGYSLIACKGLGSHKPKAPLLDDWQDTPYNSKLTAAKLPEIYGVVLKDDDLVLDFDPKRGEDQLIGLWNALSLPMPIDTLVVRTGSGGMHIYFKKPNGFKVRSTAPQFNAIEVKTRKHQVIGAGSIHESGGVYEIIKGSVDDIKPAPAALLKYLEDLVDDTRIGVTGDDEGTKQRFRIFCDNYRAAVENQGGDNTTLSVAYTGRDFGLSRESVYSIMLDRYNPRCIPPWDADDLRTKVNNAYNHAQNVAGVLHPNADLPADLGIEGVHEDHSKLKWDRDKSGKLTAALCNAVNYFRTKNLLFDPSQPNPLYDLIRYNMFAHEIEFTRPAPWHFSDMPVKYWSKTDTIMLKLWLSENTHYNAGTGQYEEASLAVSMMRPFHPVREWLRSLAWDGQPRINSWLKDYLSGADDEEYMQVIGAATLIAACARIEEPGCKHDQVLILEGRQGTGKGETVRILGGRYVPGQNWFADIPIDPDKKDTVGGSQGAWFLEASELQFNNKHDVESIKRYLTIDTDKVRLPYEAKHSILPRQSLFIGTINPGDGKYLKDPTGNRRFWPVATGKIYRDRLIQDRDQLFAEAMHRYKAGEPWHITDDRVRILAERAQQDRMVTDDWYDVLDNWLATMINARVMPDSLTTEFIAKSALNIDAGKFTVQASKRFKEIMSQLGYEHIPKYSSQHKKNIRQWVLDPCKAYGI